MKKKILSIILLGCLILSLVACGGNTALTNNEDTQVVETETKQEEVEFAYDVSDFITRGKVINENLYYDMKEGKISIHNMSDGSVLCEAEWDYIKLYLCDGCFALGKNIGENQRYYALFDKDFNKIFETDESMSGLFLQSYSEGVLVLRSLTKNASEGYDAYYYDGKNDFKLMFDTTSILALEKSGSFYDGKAVVQSWAYNDNHETPIYLDSDGTTVYGPSNWVAFPYSITKDGYINGISYNFPKDEYQGLAVYNVKTNEMYELPKEVVSTDVYTTEGAVSLTVVGDGYMTVNTDDDNSVAIYNIKTGYLTEEKYGYVSLTQYGKNKYILVSNAKETEWTYLDENFEEVGTWYTDATDFYNGYALVLEEGACYYYFVNENFEKVSDGILGDGAYLDLNNNVFCVMTMEEHEGYRFFTIKE